MWVSMGELDIYFVIPFGVSVCFFVFLHWAVLMCFEMFMYGWLSVFRAIDQNPIQNVLV